jgi:hypothetical protein
MLGGYLLMQMSRDDVTMTRGRARKLPGMRTHSGAEIQRQRQGHYD